MNVWLIQIGETFPFVDGARPLRTAYLAKALADRGHTVTWWGTSFDHFKKEWVADGDRVIVWDERLTLVAIKGLGYKKNLSLSRYLDHRLIAKKFKKMIAGHPRPDIIVAALPSYDLAFEAVRFGKKTSVPVVIDIRDQWPDIFIDNLPVGLKFFGRKVLAYDFFMARKAIQEAYALVSMMPLILKWGLTYAGRPQSNRDKVFYLGYEESDDGKGNLALPDYLRGHEKKFIISFVGTFGAYHNPSILLEAAGHLKNNGILFVLAGNGQFYNEIKEKASRLDNVVLPGWLNQKEIAALLSHSHVGMCTTTRKAFFFPNKVFTYLAAGLPIFSAFDGDLKKIIEDRKIGFFYPPDDASRLLECIRSLYDDQDLYKEMASNARQTFLELFDAGNIYPQYAEYLETLAGTFNEEKG